MEKQFWESTGVWINSENDSPYRDQGTELN